MHAFKTVSKSEFGVPFYEIFFTNHIGPDCHIHPEPDGRKINPHDLYEHKDGALFDFQMSGVQMSAWLQELQQFVCPNGLFDGQSRAPFAELIGLNDKSVYGSKLASKIASEFVEWMPYVDFFAGDKFLQTYRFWKDVFSYAGTCGAVGIYGWIDRWPWEEM